MRFIPLTLLLIISLCTCDRAQKDATPDYAPTPPSEEAPEVKAAAITDVCDLMTEQFLTAALPGIQDIEFITGNYVGVIGCKANATIGGKPYTVTIVYQEDATDAGGFKKMMETLQKMSEISDQMSPPVTISGAGDLAYVQPGTNGSAAMLRGKDLWKAIVQDAESMNDAALSEALLRKIP